jgi:hypothetical protein
MLIDMEIAARSAYFYGLHLSTAAQNIERFRRQRNNGTPFKQLRAFPYVLRGGFAPSEEEWVPRRWQAAEAPEDYFAARPKEDMDQVAVTAAPVPSSSARDDVIDASIYEYEHTNNDGASQGIISKWTRSEVAASANAHAWTPHANDDDAAKVAQCRRAMETWMVPVACVALVVVVAFSRLNARGQYRLMRLACWSMTLCHGMRVFVGMGKLRTGGSLAKGKAPSGLPAGNSRLTKRKSKAVAQE